MAGWSHGDHRATRCPGEEKFYLFRSQYSYLSFINVHNVFRSHPKKWLDHEGVWGRWTMISLCISHTPKKNTAFDEMITVQMLGYTKFTDDLL